MASTTYCFGSCLFWLLISNDLLGAQATHRTRLPACPYSSSPEFSAGQGIEDSAADISTATSPRFWVSSGSASDLHGLAKHQRPGTRPEHRVIPRFLDPHLPQVANHANGCQPSEKRATTGPSSVTCFLGARGQG
ncbi:hypothetical protein V8C42DRAFT_128572 [Trichoderma barbatum]